MKKISGYFVLSILLVFVLSQFSYAESAPSIDKMDKENRGFQEEGFFPVMPPGGPCPMMDQMREMHGFDHPFRMHMDELKLDDQQRDALREIENTALKEIIKKRADEQIAAIELKELLDSPAVDLKAVETKLKHIAAVKAEIQLTAVKSMESMKAKLTPEQRQILQKLKPAHHPPGPPMMRKGMRDKMKMHLPYAGIKGELSDE